MIKDVFVLRKSSWHMSLMKWIWNLDYRDFSHICPYFWMSVLNIVVIIPVAIFRGLAYVLKGMFGWIGDWMEARAEESYARWLDRVQANPEEELDRVARGCKADYDKLEDLLLFNQSFRSKFSSDEERRSYYIRLADARAKYRKDLYDEEQRKGVSAALRSVRRKQKIANIVKYVKPMAVVIGWAIMIALALVVIFLLYKLVMLIATIPGRGWKMVGLILGAIAVAVPVLIGLAVSLRWLVIRVACAMPSKTPAWLSFIGSIFKWFGKGIATVWDIVTTMASNSCPFIDWED